MMPCQGYHRQGDQEDEAVIAVATPTGTQPVQQQQQQPQNQQLQQKQQQMDGGDADSLLEMTARTGSRVPIFLGWTQLVFGLVGCALGVSDAGYRSGSANITAMVFHQPKPVVLFDITAAFGFPLWCSVSMIVSSILALWYSKTSLQRLLNFYRLYSLVNLTILSLGLVLLVVSWISQSHPGTHEFDSPLRVLQALNSILLITSWLLVLACVLCDFCVGKNLLQVLGIFCRTVCRKSQRDSFSELKRSRNSLNLHICNYSRRTNSGLWSLLNHQARDGVGEAGDCHSDDDILSDITPQPLF